MSDRDLLEKAAKAAGIKHNPSLSAACRGERIWWNPLIDNGDALRLAVKLRLSVTVFADAIGIGTPGRGYFEEKWKDDPYAATRRAIVRAAAQIGEQHGN